MSWRKVAFGELASVKHGYAFKGKYFSDSGKYLLLTPGNCTESGGLKLKGDREKFYIGEFPNEFILNQGDLIVVMTDLVQEAPILGGAFLIPQDDYFLHNQRLGLVSIKDENILYKKFFYYVLNSPYYRSQIRASSTGTTVKHTAPERIYRCSIALPSHNIQLKIANILSAYDDLIENNRRRIQLLERSLHLLYKEWLVHLRFPSHEHSKIVDGIPEGWGKAALKELAIVNQSSINSSFQGQIEYIDISSVTTNSINQTTILNFEDAPSRARRIVKHGDIIWSCVRPNRESYAVIWNPPDNLIVSTGFAVITPKSVPASFLFYAITTPEFVGYLANNARGAAYPAVTASDFENAQITFPQDSLLNLFDEIATPVFTQINTLRQQSKKLQQARDLLLPKLMSGAIGV